MLTFKSFTGVNNVLPVQRLSEQDLTEATNVDIGVSGEIRRRFGYSVASEDCHKNLWQGNGFRLSTTGGVLTATTDGVPAVFMALTGNARMWYCNLPDGRTAFSNGDICGITDGAAVFSWGVPTPESTGVPTAVSGALHPGVYSYLVTHVRLSDGLEGAPAEGGAVDLPGGGLLITDLPEREGFGVNVYLSGADGGESFLAGSAMNGDFSYLGSNDALVLPCRTLFEAPAPAGRVLGFWRGRCLVACGNVLYASKPHRWEAFDMRRDFKQFRSAITLVQPVAGGIYVGTEDELVFLAGDQFDILVSRQCLPYAVALGSGCSVPGDQLQRGESVDSGQAMVCIAGERVVLGYSDGAVSQLQQYRAPMGEFASTFRVVDGIPQYLAIAQ